MQTDVTAAVAKFKDGVELGQYRVISSTSCQPQVSKDKPGVEMVIRLFSSSFLSILIA